MPVADRRQSNLLRYAAFDLDGTVLDGTGTLLPELPDGIAALRGRGIHPVLVTGRSFVEFRRFCLDKQFTSLWHRRVLLNNGDVELDTESLSLTAWNVIATGVLGHILAEVTTDLVAECGRDLIAFSRRAAAAYAMAYRVPRSAIPLASALPPAARPTRLIVLGDQSRLAAALAGYGCQVGTMGAFGASVVWPPSSCKAAALEVRMAAWFGDTALDHLIAFGNETNDACMIACARVGVAVAGSRPSLRRHATVSLDSPLDAVLLDSFDVLAATARGPWPRQGPCLKLCWPGREQSARDRSPGATV